MARAKARVAASGGQMADDVLREVFARLPDVQDLLRCAVTCRRWRRLVADPADNARRPSALLGIFTQNIWLDHQSVKPLKRKPRWSPRFLSLQAGSSSALIDLTSFVADDDGLFNDARPLASRRGFLLLRIMLPAGKHYRHKLHLAVCRPLVDNRDVHLLPPPPVDLPGNSVGCAILTGADHSAYGNQDSQEQPTFQVLVTFKLYGGFVSACMYSSATQSWSAPMRCGRDAFLTRCGPRAGVVVHWLYRDTTEFYILNISATMTKASYLTKIPIKVNTGLPRQRPPLPCLRLTGEGTLALVNTRDHGVPELWTKQEQDDSGHHDGEDEDHWLLYDLANLGSERLDAAFFAESRGALLVEQGGAFFIFDLKSKEKAQVNLKRDETNDQGMRWFPANYCNSSCCGGHKFDRICKGTPPVLYEMDWVFTRRMLLTSSREDAKAD